jgi:hypothetical protein
LTAILSKFVDNLARKTRLKITLAASIYMAIHIWPSKL